MLKRHILRLSFVMIVPLVGSDLHSLSNLYFMIYLKRLIGVTLLSFASWILFSTFPAWTSIFASTPTTFSPEAWHAANKYRRNVMAQDFLERHHHVGMSREVVIQLLGKPDQESTGKLHYFVALTAADYIALTFDLDQEGRIIKAYLRQT